MSSLIIGIHAGFHDSSAVLFEDYELKAAVALERLTRVKGDASEFPHRSVDEVLSIVGASRKDVAAVAVSRMFFPNEAFKSGGLWQAYRRYIRQKPLRGLASEIRVRRQPPESVIDARRALEFVRLPHARDIHFYDHHEAHALPALFYTDWDDALLVTADGAGDNLCYRYRRFKDGGLQTIYGGEDSWYTLRPAHGLAHVYQAVTGAIGFRENRHEGKVTGLAALGEPVLYDEMARCFWVDDAGLIRSTFRTTREKFDFIRKLVRGARREDAAASVQKLVEEVMTASLRRLLTRQPAKKLGLAGGLFANVKLNQALAAHLPVDEIFVFPPMGDDGLPTGGVLAYLLRRDGLTTWLKQRRRLENVYLGRDYDADIDPALRAVPGIKATQASPAEEAARRIAAGQIGAIYAGRMEYGPRALGARSILASAANRQTRDVLNQRLERTEFMPFAPVVPAEHAAEIFDVSALNSYACRFMTMTCKVHEGWRERIPAVVHVDGTARPQIITRDLNPLYYDIVAAHGRITGVPVLVNTSFNVHEEPIVNAPEQCIRALVDGRIDFVVTRQGVYEYEGRPSRAG
jgi:carbamoyltransferase